MLSLQLISISFASISCNKCSRATLQVISRMLATRDQTQNPTTSDSSSNIELYHVKHTNMSQEPQEPTGGVLLLMVPELLCSLQAKRHYSCLTTTPSKMPSDLKLGAKSLGSTGPGRLKESVNGPGGHNCRNSISKTRDRFVIVLPPVVKPRR